MRRKTKPRLRHLRSHYILDGVRDPHRPVYSTLRDPDPRLPTNAKQFWNRAGLRLCDGGVVARHNGQVVGFCRYCLDGRSVETTKGLAMAGTWVAPRYRRQGLALRMWRLVFRKLRPKTEVWVVTISASGTAMVRQLQRLYPQLRFDLH